MLPELDGAMSKQRYSLPVSVLGGSLRHRHVGKCEPLMVPVVSDAVVCSHLDTSGERRKESVRVLRTAVFEQLA